MILKVMDSSDIVYAGISEYYIMSRKYFLHDWLHIDVKRITKDGGGNAVVQGAW